MFNYIYNKIESRILELVDKRIKHNVGEPREVIYSMLFNYKPYETEATGLFKEVEQIRGYLNVELVKTKQSEKLVAKKNNK